MEAREGGRSSESGGDSGTEEKVVGRTIFERSFKREYSHRLIDGKNITQCHQKLNLS